MPTKIGHFEILSELAKSPTGIVYKANDLESGQTVALKAIQLSAFGEHAAALEQALLAEAEATKSLSCPNITTVYRRRRNRRAILRRDGICAGQQHRDDAGAQRRIFHLGSARYRTPA